jgi:hypothetical protein
MEQDIYLSEQSLSRSRFITVFTGAYHLLIGFSTEQMNSVHTRTNMPLQ